MNYSVPPTKCPCRPTVAPSINTRGDRAPFTTNRNCVDLSNGPFEALVIFICSPQRHMDGADRATRVSSNGQLFQLLSEFQSGERRCLRRSSFLLRLLQ